MKTITFDFCPNLGSVDKIYAIPLSSFLEVKHNFTLNENYLHLTNVDDIVDIYCTQDTIQFIEEKTQQSAGPSYNVEITGVTPRSNPLNQKDLSILSSEYWLLMFVDNNGYTRLVGNKDSHLIFNQTDSTGKSLASRNQISFSFSGIQTYSSYFITTVFEI